MAIIRVNLTDQVSAWLTKTNLLSSGVGDIQDLPVQDSNVVDAINRLSTVSSTLQYEIRDSAEIVDISRNSMSADDAGGLGSFSYEVNTGTYTYTGPSQYDIRSLLATDSTIDYDVANGNFSLADHKVSTTQLKDPVSLTIYDENGTAVKTIYGAGS